MGSPGFLMTARRIREALPAEDFALFQQYSQAFQQGTVDAESYYNVAASVIPDLALFFDLVAKLPDPDKQAAVYAAHEQAQQMQAFNAHNEVAPAVCSSAVCVPISAPAVPVPPGLTRTVAEGSGGGGNAGSSKPAVVVWFRQDLRVEDNPALLRASEAGCPVIPLFIHADEEEIQQEAAAGHWPLQGAAALWVHHSLACLSDELRDRYSGLRLVLRRGKAIDVLSDLVSSHNVHTVYVNDVYEPWNLARDARVEEALARLRVKLKRHKSVVLFAPWEAQPDKTDESLMHGFGSVGFFTRACRQLPHGPGDAVEAPRKVARLSPFDPQPHSLTLNELGLYRMPVRNDGSRVDWGKGIRDNWQFGTRGAKEALEQFLGSGIFHFEGRERFRADCDFTARISPYMRFGELSPRLVFEAVVKRHGIKHARTFLRRLSWRDLFYWQLYRFERMCDEPIRPQYALQRWNSDPVKLKKWQRGRTGYPLVDAAMRQLWTTGWMPNYLRHVVASFLIEFMNYNWTHGFAWFHDTLVDADVAINAGMWQNGGHSGLDQWNFVMHPVYAAKSCDPDGDYTRRWVPELAKLPVEFIHCPWEAPKTVLAGAGINLRRDYHPRLIKDLDAAQRDSLAAVRELRLGAGRKYVLPDGNEWMELPDGRKAQLITRVDFRQMLSEPLTRQSAADKWDKSRRPRMDPLGKAMAEYENRHARKYEHGDSSMLA